MIISSVIETLENTQDDIEELTQIPEEERCLILSKITEAVDMLSRCVDEYGEDTDIEESNEEDNW